MGLYFNFSIVLLYFSIAVIYFIIKKILRPKRKTELNLISFKRYFRYIKIWLNPKNVFLIVLISTISNSIILIQNNKYENLYIDEQKYLLEAVVISNKIEKEYSNIYKIKIIDNNTNLYLKINKKQNIELEYGDKISVTGTFEKPLTARNYGGFDYSNYLKTLKIYGTLKLDKIEVIQKNALNPVYILANKASIKIKKNIDEIMQKEQSAVFKGLILGDTAEIEKDLQEDFRTANISHILAVSGMHISYIIIGLNLLSKNIIGKRKTKYVIIIFLSFYMVLTGFSPSVVRAGIMGILVTLSGILHRKNDMWTAIAISLLIILINNPYSIMGIGLQFSYIGTIGIIIFHKNVLKLLKSLTIKNKKIRYKVNAKIVMLIDKLKEILAVTISAQIGILPVMIYHFNIVGIYVLLSNVLITLIIGTVMIIGFLVVIISFICMPIAKGVSGILVIGIKILIQISKISELPLSKIYIATPKIESIILYYLCASLLNQIYSIYHLTIISNTQKRVRNLIALFKFQLIQNRNIARKMTARILIFILIFICINPIVSKKLKIYFVDVGQGDCTLIVTPKNKTILVDGGGSLMPNVDVGKNTLIPYILDRGYTKIDYIFISHFDQDHVGGILTILEELKVGQVVISKQAEDSENYQKFLEIVEKNKIKVYVVEAGQRINIEKNLYFDVLWPDSNNVVTENSLNNNSLVSKFVYRNFSILFTGDIEEVAEKKIVSMYNKNNILDSTVLKVAHHGSKTSSCAEFITTVKPKMALIGVGKNNKFGHPNSEVLDRLKNIEGKIYRTDENGEISFLVDTKGKICK